jgi:mannan endo-1,4-beta-mannosidase
MNAILIAFAVFTGAGIQHRTSIRVEAETGQLVGTTVATTRSGYSGKGYVTGFTKDGDKVVIKFLGKPGIYEAMIRYCASMGPKGYELGVNGVKTSGMFPATGTRFATTSAGKVELKTGRNTVEIDKGWGYFDVDYVEFVPSKVTHSLRKPPLILADANATAKTKALLANLLNSYGSSTLSGQYDNTDCDFIAKTTLKTPAIFAADFMDYSPSRVEHSPAPNGWTENAVHRGQSGQIISMSWHWNAPTDLIDKMLKDSNGKDVDANWYKGFYTYATNFDLSAAIDDPTSANYKLIVRDIDAIADQLQKFADANIPVLWRPLHEAEGGWFWWGAKGPAPFVKLWRLMFNELTVVRGLHNLIWVFTVGNNPQWYPGDAYVDVLGVDAYPSDHSEALSSTWDNLKKQFDGKKMLAISEFGGVPDIPRMHRFGVEWAYFVSWPGEIQPPGTSKANLLRIYRDASVKNKQSQ